MGHLISFIIGNYLGLIDGRREKINDLFLFYVFMIDKYKIYIYAKKLWGCRAKKKSTEYTNA